MAVFAAADLRTGEVKLSTSAPTYQNASGTSSFTDTSIFSSPDLMSGNDISIRLRFELDGAYRGGSQVAFTVGAHSAFIDVLNVTALYRGTFLGVGGQAVSGGTFSAVAPGAGSQIVNGGGDRTILGPNVFEGEIDIFSFNSVLGLMMTLNGTGVLDFADTGTVSLTLPERTSFASASNAFFFDRRANYSGARTSEHSLNAHQAGGRDRNCRAQESHARLMIGSSGRGS